MPTVEKVLEDFTDREIRDEYVARFGDPDDADADLDDFSSPELIAELEFRNDLPEGEVEALDEIADLIAEAARISPHAARAYQLLRSQNERLPTLAARQSLTAGRMAEAA